MDEARIEIGTRSSNWVWAAAMNVVSNTTFASYSSVTQQTPPLTLAPGTNALTLTWPGYGVGFALFTATNLASPVVWNPATNTLALVSNQWQAVLPPTDGNVRFYRLRSQ
jgi:hypothetical protein